MLRSMCSFKTSIPPAETSSPGITEIVLPSTGNFHLVLPTLACMSQAADTRWFTWLPPAGLSRELLVEFGFKLSSIRLIHPRNENEIFSLTRQALQEGNSSLVVSSPGLLTDRQLGCLETAAMHGNTTGILMRYRSH